MVEQEHGGGLADDVAAPDDDSMLAGDGKAAALEDFNDAGGRAGRERGTASEQAAGVDGVKAVNILGGSDGVEEDFGIDLRRERELDEDAVDVVAVIETGD